MPKLNAELIIKRMCIRGFNRGGLAKEAGIALRTVVNVLKGKNVSPATQTAIAEALDVDPGSLVLWTDSDHHPRRISGRWEGEAKDLVVPGRIEYDIEPVTYQINMTVKQNGWQFTAEGHLIGQEKTPQPFEAHGSLKEDGNYVVFEWSNTDPTIGDYGIALLEHTADGKRLEGYYVGRERIHSLKVIFGWICVSREPTPAAK
jgi:hypothetical protein